MIRLLVALIALVVALPAQAQSAPPNGRYVFAPGSRPVASLSIEGDGAARRIVHERPAGLGLNSRELERVEGDAVRFAGGPGTMEGGALVAALNNGSGDTRSVRIEPVDADTVALTYTDVDVAPILLRRSQAALQLEDLPAALPLALDEKWPDNPEMAAIFVADQAARQGGIGAETPEDARRMREEDTARRARTRALLDAGALRSATDFYHAAFVYQHGEEPEDYLLAHILATSAMARGNGRASWIAAATLDRYLQSIGRGQVFGTQYNGKLGENGAIEWSMGDYDEALLPDLVRLIHSVPTRDAQEERLEQYAKDMPGD